MINSFVVYLSCALLIYTCTSCKHFSFIFLFHFLISFIKLYLILISHHFTINAYIHVLTNHIITTHSYQITGTYLLVAHGAISFPVVVS